MHDSSMMKGLIRSAAAAAPEGGRVVRVRVRVGALSGISAGHLQDHFDEASAGTPLEGASLLIEEGPDGVAALEDSAALGVLLVGLDVEGR